MNDTLVLLSGLLLFADCILCILIFHTGIMKTTKSDSPANGCALGVALSVIYISVLACVLILIKKNIYPFLQHHTNSSLFILSVITFSLLLSLISCLSEKSHYTMSQIDKMDGKTFEKACADILKHHGFSKVEITGRSGDGGVDILACKGNIKYAIQCKRYKNKLGNSSIQEVFSGKAYYHCDKAVVMTNSYFTKPAIQYANHLHVELWDRDYLTKQLAIGK